MFKLVSRLGMANILVPQDQFFQTKELLSLLQISKPQVQRKYLATGRDSVVFYDEKCLQIAKIYPTLSLRQIKLYYAMQKAFNAFCQNTTPRYREYGWLQKVYTPQPNNIATVYPKNKDIFTVQTQNDLYATLAILPYIHGEQKNPTQEEQIDIKKLYHLFLSQYLPTTAHKIFYTSPRSDKEKDFVSSPNIKITNTGQRIITDINDIAHYVQTIEENCLDCYAIFGVK